MSLEDEGLEVGAAGVDGRREAGAAEPRMTVSRVSMVGVVIVFSSIAVLFDCNWENGFIWVGED